MGPSMAGARDPAWPPPPCARCGRAQSSWARIIIYKDKQYLCTDCREANIVHLTWRVVLSGLPRNSPVLAVVDSILLFLESPTRLERIRYLHHLIQGPAYTYSPFNYIDREYNNVLYQQVHRRIVGTDAPDEVRTYLPGARWLTTTESLTTLILYYVVPMTVPVIPESFTRCNCCLAQVSLLAANQGCCGGCAHCIHRWWLRVCARRTRCARPL